MLIRRRGSDWSRRIGGLVTVVATLFLVMLMALPSWAATFTIDLPFDVVRADPGERVLLRTETIADALVGQSCSVMATGNNNESVHLGNDIEIVSGNTVTLFGVEDVANSTTMADGELSLTDTITITLVLGEEDGVYSAGLSILLDCNATTTTTTTTTTTSTTTIVGIAPTTEATTTTLDTQVGGITLTTTTTQGEQVGGITVTTGAGLDDTDATDVLPFTGLDSNTLVSLGAIALCLGLLILVAARREEA